MKKYELTEETKTDFSRDAPVQLHRIIALRDFGDVKKGDLGGWIEKEKNLGHSGNCWIYDNATVFDDAEVSGNATIHDRAKVYENANVSGDTKISGNATVHGHSRVLMCAEILENADVRGEAYIFGNSKIYGNGTVYQFARVCDCAKIYGNAVIGDYARIQGDAEIFGNNTLVTGRAKIGTLGWISSTMDYVTIGPIGSRKSYTTIYKIQQFDPDKYKSVRIQCGCFNGYFDHFINKVKYTHKSNSIYYKQYTELIPAIIETM